MNGSPGGHFVEMAAALAATLVGSMFAAGDAALTSMPEAHLQALASDTTSQGATFRRYAQDPLRVLSRWLVVRIVGISLAAALVHDAAKAWGLSELGPVVAMLAAVVSYGTFTEILCTLARRRPVQFGALALTVLRPLEWAVIPLAEPLAWLGRLVGRRFPASRKVDARITETEVEWAVTEGERAGAIENAPAEMIRKVLDFKDLTAREIMVPRRRVNGIELTTPLEKVIAHVACEGHSRYPVYRETLDNVVGLLYAKDLFAVVRDKRVTDTRLAQLMRTPVMFVAETQPASKILPEMQSRRLHMAIVSDEFGGTGGIITLEDILEEIVGDIRDEYDTEAQITDVGQGHVIADAAVSLDELSHHLGLKLPTDGEFESLGGLIVHRTGRVPAAGFTLRIDGLQMIVREADERRVVKVEIVCDAPKDEPPTASSPAL